MSGALKCYPRTRDPFSHPRAHPDRLSTPAGLVYPAWCSIKLLGRNRAHNTQLASAKMDAKRRQGTKQTKAEAEAEAVELMKEFVLDCQASPQRTCATVG